MNRIKLGILQVNHDKSVEVGDAFPDDAHRFRDLFDLQEERFQYRIYMTIEKKTLMGACFGHQAIAQALGGSVERSTNGYNTGIEQTEFQSLRPWMKPERDQLPLYMFHEDQVTQLPEGCDLLGSSENCKIASFAKGEHIFTTQAHPEFNHEFMSCVLRFTESKMDSTTATRAWQSMKQKQEGDVFARWCTEFFKGV